MIQQYSTDQAELNAFETGQIDVMDTGQSGSGVPVSEYPHFVNSPDWGITPVLGAALYHGIYFNLNDGTPGAVFPKWGCAMQNGNSGCGLEIRQAIAHLWDRARYVSDGPLQGGGVPLSDGVPANKAGGPSLTCGRVTCASPLSSPNDNLVTNSGGPTTIGGQCTWDTLDGSTLPNLAGVTGAVAYNGVTANPINSGYGGCVSALHLAPCPGGFCTQTGSANPGTPDPDFCAAVDHLIMANLDSPALGLRRDPAAPLDRFGHSCGIDPASPGLANMVANPLRAKVRSTDPRLTLGNSMIAGMQQLFGGQPVNVEEIGSGGTLGAKVFFCCGDPAHPLAGQWEWYTFGYQDTNPFPTTLYTYADSSFASNVCGGPLNVEPSNPTFMCITAADTPLLNLATDANLQGGAGVGLYNDAYTALNILNQRTLDIPGYTFALRTGVLRAVDGAVVQLGVGYENAFFWNTAHKGSYDSQVTDQRFRFDGGPGNSATCTAFPGGGADYTACGRWGLAGGDIVTTTNPYPAQWVWEFDQLAEIYDTLFSLNPAAPTQNYCFVCVSATFKTVSGNQVWDVVLRQNVRFQDNIGGSSASPVNGGSVDAYDIAFAILTLRDQGGSVTSGICPLCTAVNVVSPTELQVSFNGASVTNYLSIGGNLILPRHIWEDPAGLSAPLSSCVDATVGQANPAGAAPCYIVGHINGQAQRVGRADPAKTGVSYDPIQHGTLIGTSVFECRSVFPSDFGKLGTGCTVNSDGGRGGSALSGGAKMILSRFDSSATGDAAAVFARLNNPGTTATAYNGRLQQTMWADVHDCTDGHTGDANCPTPSINIVSTADAALASGNTAAADYSYWFSQSPVFTAGTELNLANSELDTTLISTGTPGIANFQWNTGSLPGIATYPDTF